MITTGSPPGNARSGPPGQENRLANAPGSADGAPKVTRDADPRTPQAADERLTGKRGAAESDKPPASRRAVRKDVRVRKARHSGACPACRRLVLVGDLIASVRGGPFMCAAHVTREETT